MALKGFDQLMLKLKSLEKAEEWMKEPLGDIGAVVRDAARMNIAGSTGDLRQSLDFEVFRVGSRIWVEIFTPLEYAVYVEFGTGPKGEASHAGTSPEVNPRYSPTGWFVHVDDFPDYARYGYEPIEIKGEQFIFTKGQEAQPFLYPAIADNKDQLIKMLQKAINQKVREAANGKS